MLIFSLGTRFLGDFYEFNLFAECEHKIFPKSLADACFYRLFEYQQSEPYACRT